MSSTTHRHESIESQQIARIYRILGEEYLEPPTADRVDSLGIWASEWRCTADSLPPELDDSLATIAAGANADDQELRVAFTRLFRGIHEQVGADPPYESLYTEGQLFGSTAREIRNGYAAAGFDVDVDERNELPDHLGLELQYLGELCATTDEDRTLSAERTTDAVRWMLEEHLLDWVPSFQQQVHAADPPAYYTGVVDLTVAVLEYHHEALH